MNSTVDSSTRTQACSCKGAARSGVVKWTTAGGILTALGICAACCLLPFTLITLGVAGAWVGSLESLSRYKWYFISATIVLLGYGFYAVYWKPKQTCAAGSGCPNCGAGKGVKVGLWLGVLLAVGGFAFEYLEPFL